MDLALLWMGEHWATMLAIFWVLEKVVKLTPWKYDDILIDILWGGIKKALGKN